ncbi:magnesium and cobalt transport protein CorA [Kitasatospora sp. NPDC101801]|uniref:magnesium and cobalt transport protein CorA n=1 Tax=Kitasatospora sp. NPDC101801 TaxID=3364103 RepID=UPI003810E925
MGSQAVVDCALYEDGHRLPGRVEPAKALKKTAERPGRFVWLGLYEPTAAQFADIANAFELHPLAAEDAVCAHQRPKLEHYGDTLFLVLKTIVYVEHDKLTATSEIVDTGEIMVFAGPGFAIVVRHGSAPPLTEVRKDLERSPELLALGPTAVLHAVADHVVDQYLEVATEFERDVEELETAVFSPERTNDAGRIYQLKRELMEFKRAVVPLGLPLQQLSDKALPQVPAKITAYLRDVADHHTQAAERILAFDELVTSMLGASMARMSLQQNTDMRRISAGAALVAVPTMVVGVYGMNFDHMPELAWTYGYPAVLLAIAAACALVFRAFRRNKWL